MGKLDLYREIDFKNDIGYVIVGVIVSAFAACIIVGYPSHIYDISHILLFMAAICLWILS